MKEDVPCLDAIVAAQKSRVAGDLIDGPIANRCRLGVFLNEGMTQNKKDIYQIEVRYVLCLDAAHKFQKARRVACNGSRALRQNRIRTLCVR